MKLLSIIMLFLLRANIFAADDPIADQIRQAQTVGKKIVLVLGATPPESGNLKFPGFDQDPFVVYLNDIHFRDIEHLRSAEASAEIKADWEKQFILGNFNSLSDLSAIKDRFSTCFDLITLDFSVSKFMGFTGQHLHYFLKMLTISGRMVFDHTPSCIVLTLKRGDVVQSIASDDEALDLCFGWLDVAEERLEYKPCVKVNWRHELSAESAQLLREFYAQYIAGWKTIHMPDACELHVFEDSVFPYWQATGHTDRDRWISELRHYLVMRRLG
jgi:hypothetical protein